MRSFYVAFQVVTMPINEVDHQYVVKQRFLGIRNVKIEYILDSPPNLNKRSVTLGDCIALTVCLLQMWKILSWWGAHKQLNININILLII